MHVNRLHEYIKCLDIIICGWTHLDMQAAMRAPILRILSTSWRMLKSRVSAGLSLSASFTCTSVFLSTALQTRDWSCDATQGLMRCRCMSHNQKAGTVM